MDSLIDILQLFLPVLFLIAVNLGLLSILFYIEKTRGKCWLYTISLIALNIFLLMNTSDWNEGRMTGSSYIIPFLKPATDTLYGLLLLSIFTAFIPLGIYFISVGIMILIICRIQKKVNPKYL